MTDLVNIDVTKRHRHTCPFCGQVAVWQVIDERWVGISVCEHFRGWWEKEVGLVHIEFSLSGTTWHDMKRAMTKYGRADFGGKKVLCPRCACAVPVRVWAGDIQCLKCEAYGHKDGTLICKDTPEWRKDMGF